MAAPADLHPSSEVELTQPSRGLADQTAVGGRSGGMSRCGFGPPLAAGEVGSLGPYRIVRQLGKGGMGAVYAAVDARLDRKLALKVMLPEAAADADAKERFLREARAAAQISHDNVVTVYEADERDGVPYIAMQFLEGSPLDAYLKRKGPPTVPQTMRLAREAAAGLTAAHRLGLVHRDIKPGNLWLEAPNGRVKVLDFGLAKPVHAEVELTQSGMVVGTPAYMSPEQARGARVDARSDLFSLGAVLYRLCTDRLPFDGPTTMAVLMALGADDPRPVRELNPEVPEPFAALIHQLLAKGPDERPQSAAEVVRRLQAIANGTGASNVVVTPSPRVVYVPVQVTGLAAAPPFANPFADLDTTESDEIPADATDVTDAPAPRRGRVSWLWPAFALAAFLAVCGAAALVATRGTGPAAEKAEPVPKSRALPPVKAPEAERTAAEWVLSAGGTVRVNGEQLDVRSPADLPREKFALTGVSLAERPVADADLARLKECPALTRVDLRGTRVTDAGLAHLKDLPDLTVLDLSETRVNGAGLVHLKGARGLALRLNKAPVADAGWANLKDLTGLVELWLNETPLTDAALEHLRGLKGLGLLSVRNTRATIPGLTQFHAHLRGCRIECDGGFIQPVAAEWVAAQWVLSVGGTVGVNGDGKELRAATDLPAPPGPVIGAGPVVPPFALTRINLGDRTITDDDLARLVHCKNLTELVLHNAKVTDAGVSHLRSLPQLRFLSLTGTETTGAGLARLKGLTALTTLHLSRTKVTDAGFAHLTSFSELTELQGEQLPVTDAGLAHLKGLARLKGLGLNDTPVSDAGLAHLAGLTELGSVHLARTKVTGSGLVHLRDCKRLGTLVLAGSPVNDAGLAHLAQMHSIAYLHLEDTAVTDAGVAHISTIKSLFVLDLSRTAVTDAGLMHLRDHGHLPHPTINNKHLTRRGVLAYQAARPGQIVWWSKDAIYPIDIDRTAALWVLEAGGKVQVNGTADEIVTPDELPKDKFALTGVQLNGQAVADRELAALRHLKQLTVLGLRNSGVTDAGLAHLKGLSSLRRMRLDGTKVTDAGLGALKDVPLTNLDVRSTAVTPKGAEALRATGCKVELGEPEPKR